MKSLYESILSTTGAGKQQLAQKVIQWFVNTEHFKDLISRKHIEYEIKAEPQKNNSWAIDIKVKGVKVNKNGYWYFGSTDCFDENMIINSNKKLPYRIYSVTLNGQLLKIKYQRLNFDSCDELCQLTNGTLILSNVKIDKLNKLPKDCKKLYFSYSHNLGGGSGCIIKEISDISLEFFGQGGSKEGLHCLLSHIKNIKVSEKMYITDCMFAGNCLEKGKDTFTKEANQLLDEFIKNNKVDVDKIVFRSVKNDYLDKAYNISYDQKTGTYKLKLNKDINLIYDFSFKILN